MNKLTLRYRYDDSFFDPRLTRDDFGYLEIAVTTEKFSGRGGFWVQWQDVTNLSLALATFPITEDQPVEASWGFDMQEGEDLIIFLRIRPAGKRGDLRLDFEVADQHSPRDRVRGSFLTNYSDIDAFQAQIALVMNNELEEAVLNGQ